VRRWLAILAVVAIAGVIGAAILSSGAPTKHRQPAFPARGVVLFGRVNLPGNATELHDFQLREAQLGRRFDGFMTYVAASGPVSDARSVIQTDHPPYVILSWATGPLPPTVIDGVAAGRYDSRFATLADFIKARPTTTFIVRLFWEFNYTGSVWNDTHYGGSPQPFIAAWRRVVRIFRAKRVLNVLFDWNPIRVASSASQDPRPYYPGNHFVDVIGTDAYPKNVQLSCYQLATTGVNGSNWYAEYSAKKYGKPLMFGEIGIQSTDHYAPPRIDRSAWWRQCLTDLRKLPAIRAFEYFDSQESPAKPNWRVDAPGTLRGDSGAQALHAYRAFANNPYLNPVGR
jgi:Glycosyl hydrolase family 26